MSRQLPLGLQLRYPTRLDDFVHGDGSPLPGLLQTQLGADGEPLIFLHGEPGSGRTHLLMGQCTAAQQQGLAVAYLPCTDIQDLAPEEQRPSCAENGGGTGVISTATWLTMPSFRFLGTKN